MGGVSVDSDSIRNGKRVCEAAIEKLKQASLTLTKQYQEAGSSGWRDDKYNDLGRLIEQCNGSLNKPVRDLEESLSKLQLLLEEVERYESTKII